MRENRRVIPPAPDFDGAPYESEEYRDWAWKRVENLCKYDLRAPTGGPKPMNAYAPLKQLHLFLPNHVHSRLLDLQTEMLKNEQLIHLFATDTVMKPTLSALGHKAMERLILEFSPNAFGQLPRHATDPHTLNPWNSF